MVISFFSLGACVFAFAAPQTDKMPSTRPAYVCGSAATSGSIRVHVTEGHKSATLVEFQQRGMATLGRASCVVEAPLPGRRTGREERKILSCRTPGTADYGYDISLTKKRDLRVVADVKRRTLAGPRPFALNLVCKPAN